MSTKTGFAPARIMASTVAMKVCEDVITLSPRADAQCQQGQVQCRSTGSHTDCALRADGSRKCLLKIRHFRAENETRIADNTFDGRVYFGFVGSVLGFEIDQRYSDDSLSLTGNSLGAVGR